MNRLAIYQKYYFSNPLSGLKKQSLDDSVEEEPSEHCKTRSSLNNIVIIQSLHSKTIIENFEDKRILKRSWRDDFIWL
ncbi:unnamed protein product (macronuclear) [Paramecium tetraurelia]|uniref:Uncharacterized protein n=1 Tax=Paramecium tetraurelia TaxID=5888 RepID=A0D0V2_PARTE|nr:uncharacterized protein GSPATT00012221001 [Paramecium tetraurelia]CAK76669.1 unnamed protein product [Paramecium tetraurelia]|eukprot:XP_001444066.1 hypothetical protein (macronuclear) [Paramecium tetraurelia strain d4-2]